MQPICRRTVLGIAAVVLFACSGCPANPPVKPVAAPPFASTAVKIHCPPGPARTLLERHGKAWATVQQAKIHLDAAEADADLIVFAPAEMGRLAESGRLQPLPTAVTGGELWSGLMRQQKGKLALWGAQPYALPLLADATILIYRRDVLGTPPATVTEYAAQAKDWAAKRNGVSLPPLPASDDGLDREFFTAAAAFAVTPVGENDLQLNAGSSAVFEFHRRASDAAPRIAEPSFVAAQRWLQALQPYRSKTASLVDAFTKDEAVMGLGTLTDFAALQKLSNSRYAVAPIPAGAAGERVPYVGPGGAMIAVAKAAPAAALSLLQHLTAPKLSEEIVHDPTFASAPFRESHLKERREGWFNYGLDPGGTAQLTEALRTATEPRTVNAPLRLRTPDQAEYRRLLLAKVRECLEKNDDAEAALKAAADAWRERDKAMPSVLTDYLRSLGVRS